MPPSQQSPEIRWFDFSTPQMRAFHMTWGAFFLSFFAWFAIAPLMTVVRDELKLTKEQIGWCLMASVGITILARLAAGWLCDWYGPRLTYTWLLILGSIPVMGIGLSTNFETFLFFRLMIGIIGASFVVTQYHTTRMFAPNIVGTANATTAGWGNLGGGVTQFAMPLLFAGLVGGLALSPAAGWRVAMIVAGAACTIWGVLYYYFTQDTPEGNFSDIGEKGGSKVTAGEAWQSFLAACRDHRVWALFVAYGACFGIELTIKGIAAMYFADYFGLDLFWAGVCAFCYGGMNIFARTLGGYVADRWGAAYGQQGRVKWLFITLIGEGLLLLLFAQMAWIALAIPALMIFACFVQMSAGATFAVVPFINRKALGAVAAIVGAGGNVAAVMFGFLFTLGWEWPIVLTCLGFVVLVASSSALFVQLEEEAPVAEASPAAAQPEPFSQPLMEPAMAGE